MSVARAEALLLTPGAGSDRDNTTLVALDEGLDLAVSRIDLRSRSVDKCVAIIAEAAELLAESAGVTLDRVAIGGRSFGGRMCSIAASRHLGIAALVLLSYPLHPPGKPDQLRTDHFGDITVPTLFVSGDRDPFGTPAEFDTHVGAIAGPVDRVWLAGATHDPKKHIPDIVTSVAAWLA
ncbi:MAG: dienelactone hydrolase [Acidimicrobiia bacterium]|nr:dienelactone hydrolase [Acidimicrobiia bacterium]